MIQSLEHLYLYLRYISKVSFPTLHAHNLMFRLTRMLFQVTKAYLANGKDGYDCLADAKVLIDEENGPTLTYALQNHFR